MSKETLERRISRLEAEVLRQAALITEMKEQIKFLKSAPSIAWWQNQSAAVRDATLERRESVDSDAMEAAGK